MADEKEDRIASLNQWFKESEDNQTAWKKQAQEDLNFYLGEQWDKKDLDILDQQNRPHLTFNHIRPRVNLVMGYQIQNRQELKVYNKKEGSKEVADILTAIIKHIYDNSNGNFETSLAFLNGITMAKSYLVATTDYDYDIYNGEIKVESDSPFRIYPDPYSEKYDFSDATHIFRIAWLPKRKIELLYPDKKDELGDIQSDDRDRLIITTESNTYKPATPAESTYSTAADKYKYRVKQAWWREYVSETFLYDLNTGIAKKTELKNEEIKLILARMPNLRKIKRVVPVMHCSTYVGNIMLEDIIPYEDNGGLKRFPIVPFYPYFIEGQFQSLVTPLKDPQREVNKRYSQLLHHLNMSANSGWIGDSDAVQDWDKLEEMGSKAGITIKKKPGSYLERIQPAALSEGHLVLAREGANQLNNISGIDPTLFGVMPEQRESGIALQIRQRQSITGIESIFENYRTSKQLFGKVLIELIQKSGCYSKEEILRIVVDGEEKEYKINQKSVQRKIFGVGKILNDITIGEYDCYVSETSSNPTLRLARFYSLLEAVKAGIPIPPEMIIKASDLPDKEEVLEGLAKQQQAQAQTVQAQNDMKMKELGLKDKELNLKAQLGLLETEVKREEKLSKS